MSEQTTTTNISEAVASKFSQTDNTPYAIHKVVNALLKQAGKAEIPPQMMYNYARNGLINGQKGQLRYTRDESTKFVVKYVDKRLSA